VSAMRIVLDANVLVSAFISAKGAPALILERWREAEFDVLISPEILSELDHVLHYPKLRQHYHLPEESIEGFLRLLAKQAIHVAPTEQLAVVERDPTDNRYLECALAGKATIIVSGDRHLLELGRYREIQILTPAGFLAFLKLARL